MEEEPFGTLLGKTDGGVEVFSCNYATVDKSQWEHLSWFEKKVLDVFTGFKWQCVELARRYLLINFGVVFENIPMAFQIFYLKSVTRVKDNEALRIHSFPNGSDVLPVKGSLLIWEPIGEFKHTGHVAVIVDVTDTHVDVVEQNVDDTIWPAGQTYSRRLRVTLDAQTGAFQIFCTFPDTEILGWINLSLNETYNYEDHPNCVSDQIQKRSVTLSSDLIKKPWLDTNVEYLRSFVDAYGADLASPDEPSVFYTLTESGDEALQFATNELHKIFLSATDYVLHHEKEIGHHFKIPAKLWPKIRKSWFRNRRDLISGRLDFAITENGMKVYEYNADSASCLLECGFIQDRWSDVAGIGNAGRSNSSELFEKLIATWKEKAVEGPLHLLCDDDKEERYHTMYMKAAAEEAGITCYMQVGLDGISWNEDGNLEDCDSRVIKNVWKTWSWRTALNQLSEDEIIHYLDRDEEFYECKKSPEKTSKPQLVDILLHSNIRIFEPLWTILPSSKAILPVLWSLKPKHPYLLNSSFDLSPEFVRAGYVAKPVTGRAGANVSLFGAQGELIEKTEGKWTEDTLVYQELSMLPKFDDDYVQFCTWAINGTYGGTVLRVDRSGIINMQSKVYPVRVVPDL